MILRHVFIVNLTALYIEQSIWGKKGTVGESKIAEKIETLCWLCDKYGHLAGYEYCSLRYFRLIKPYKDDHRM